MFNCSLFSRRKPTCWSSLVIGLLATITAANAIAGEPGYDIDALSPEQAELAYRMLAFVDGIEA